MIRPKNPSCGVSEVEVYVESLNTITYCRYASIVTRRIHSHATMHSFMHDELIHKDRHIQSHIYIYICMYSKKRTHWFIYNEFIHQKLRIQSYNDEFIRKDDAFIFTRSYALIVTRRISSHTMPLSFIYREFILKKWRERWGAGVEYHCQEIYWALRPVVNGT